MGDIDTKTPKTSLEELPLAGTTATEISGIQAKAAEEAQRLYGNDKEKIRAHVSKVLATHIQFVLGQYLKREVGSAFAKALEENLKNDPALRKQLGEHMGQLLLQGVLKQQQSEQSANDEYRKRFGTHQDDAINKARDAYAAPYQAMAGLSSLGVFVGGIAKMLGKSMPNADWSAQAISFGDSLLDGAKSLGKFAGDEIIRLESLADKTKRAPKDWNATVTVNVTPEFLRLAQQFQGILSPDLVRQLYDRTNGQIDLRGSTPLGSNSGYYGPVSCLSNATRDQVFSAMIMQESGGDPNARSNKGAMGLGQMMPGTAPAAAKLAGLAWDQTRYNSDPAYQLQLSRAWFDHLADKYDGNMVLTLAAYNSGEGAVNDFMNGTNLSKNTRNGPTNPSSKKLGDPRKGETTDAAFAENYPYGETRIYIGRIADKVARGSGYDVAKAEAKAAIDKARTSSKDELADKTRNDHAAAAARTSAPRGSGSGRAVDRSAAELNHGNAGEAKVEKKVTVAVGPRILPAPAPKTV